MKEIFYDFYIIIYFLFYWFFLDLNKIFKEVWGGGVKILYKNY